MRPWVPRTFSKSLVCFFALSLWGLTAPPFLTLEMTAVKKRSAGILTYLGVRVSGRWQILVRADTGSWRSDPSRPWAPKLRPSA